MRHRVVHFLASQGVPGPARNNVELVVSELVTNAIIHPRPAEGPHDVRVEVSAGEDVVVCVSNVGPAADIPPVEEWRPAPPAAKSGRGLGVVRQICRQVSVSQIDERAVVSCLFHNAGR